MVVLDGLTKRVNGLANTLLLIAPSDQPTVHGAVPVKAAWMAALLPAQIVVVPLTTAVGFEETVRMAGLDAPLPQELVNQARYCLPLSLKVTMKV